MPDKGLKVYWSLLLQVSAGPGVQDREEPGMGGEVSPSQHPYRRAAVVREQGKPP